MRSNKILKTSFAISTCFFSSHAVGSLAQLEHYMDPNLYGSREVRNSNPVMEEIEDDSILNTALRDSKQDSKQDSKKNTQSVKNSK